MTTDAEQLNDPSLHPEHMAEMLDLKKWENFNQRFHFSEKYWFDRVLETLIAAERERDDAKALLVQTLQALHDAGRGWAWARKALEEAVGAIASGRVVSIGALRNTYAPQINVSTVQRWLAVLAAETPKEETP
jgi:hypothetical protein